MTTTKQITPKGKMSNLVGMYAFVWEDEKLKATLFIKGTAGEYLYIVQALSGLDGEGNVCKIIHIDKMMDWYFYPSLDIANMVMEDYGNNQINRYKFPILF